MSRSTPKSSGRKTNLKAELKIQKSNISVSATGIKGGSRSVARPKKGGGSYKEGVSTGSGSRKAGTSSRTRHGRGGHGGTYAPKGQGIEGTGSYAPYKGRGIEGAGTHAPYQGKKGKAKSDNGGAGNNNGNGNGQPPRLPNSGNLIVLEGILLKKKNNEDVDSLLLIGPQSNLEELTDAKNQLEELTDAGNQLKERNPQTAGICNNLGCAYAFLYEKTREFDYLKEAKSSLRAAAKATEKKATDPPQFDDAKATGKEAIDPAPSSDGTNVIEKQITDPTPSGDATKAVEKEATDPAPPGAKTAEKEATLLTSPDEAVREIARIANKNLEFIQGW